MVTLTRHKVTLYVRVYSLPCFCKDKFVRYARDTEIIIIIIIIIIIKFLKFSAV
jgi:hypothetical protein